MTVMVAEAIRSSHGAQLPPGRRLDQVTPVIAERILPSTRAVFVAFAIFTLLAAFDLGVLTASTDQYFAWTIAAEPAAGFLGAAYAAGFLLSVLCLRRQRWTDIRIAMFTVTAFAVLTLVASLLHLHKFHLMMGGPVARFAAWVWLTVYVVIPVACVIVVGRQERRRRRPEVVRRPMPGLLVGLLAGQAAMLFAAGALLFAGGAMRHHAAMEWTHFWPLPAAPLAAQAAGTWMLVFGIAAVLAIRERDLSRLVVPAVAYAAFGAFELLVLLRYREQVSASGPWLWAYVALLVSIVVAGGYGSWTSRTPTAAGNSAH